jgi:foldase protein PrsA
MAKDTKKTQKVSVKKDEIKSNKKVVIEEVVDTKKDTKKNKKKLSSFIKAADDKRWVILAGVVGFLVATLLFRCILWPDRIATLKDGTQPVASFSGETFTADDLYKEMKKHYSVNVLLNEIDNVILTEKYPENDEMNTEVNETAEYYYNVYGQSGYSKEDFLSNYGFASEKDFVESLKLDYRRNKYFESYAEGLVTEKEIDKYYKNEVFGDVDSKHILVKVDKDNKDGLSDKEAEKLAKEIISKLNSGKTWDEVVKEYKDKIVHEELGYQAFNASLEASYLKECKNLEVGKYSKTPVLTSYGYHIVYKIQQKDKPALEDVKDDVIDVLANDIKNNDTNLYYKALIAMREDAKLEFIDTKLGDEYKKYTSTYK